MNTDDTIKIFIGSGEASLLERKTLIYSLHKHTNNLDIYVFNGTHNAIEHNQDEPVQFLPPKLKYFNGTTEFGLYRFTVQICHHKGKAIYLILI
jgi:hypothetical protein